jgi:hypothetical protein
MRKTSFDLKVEFSREVDGRWIVDVPALPGVTVYGRTRKQALGQWKYSHCMLSRIELSMVKQGRMV